MESPVARPGVLFAVNNMYKINGTEIKLVRGDSFFCEVTMKIGSSTYEPSSGDVVRFAMKKDYKNATVLIEKVIPNNTLLLHLEPDDTKQLPFSDYVYDIELTKANGDVDTFISGKLILLPEVK